MLAPPYQVHGQKLRITASNGVGVLPRDGQDAKTLTKSADAAMYQTKEENRDAFRFRSERQMANQR